MYVFRNSNTSKLLFLRLILIFLLPFGAMAQDTELERRVMRKHSNGREHVVLYLDKLSGDLKKEEVFFPNGKPQWIGSYNKNIEDGSWQFYYENGKIKAVENYVGGKEHGVSTFYDESGKKIKEEFWKHGRMIKQTTY